MQNVCRTCMGDSVTLVNIFSDVRDPALEQPQSNLSHILNECTNHSVRRDDCQPQFICLTCVQAAHTAFRFKQQCDRSYLRFCDLQKNGHLKEDQDRNTKQAEHKEASKAEDSRSDSSPAGHGGANDIQMKLCQTLDETQRTQNIYNVVDNRYVCSYCPNTYKTKGGLRRHLLIHSSKPDHSCPYCSKVFWRRDSYINHLLAHDKRGFVSSNQSDGGTIKKKLSVLNDNLKADNIDINKENSFNAIAENPPFLTNVHKNLCDHCSDSFILEDDLKVHRMLEHDINVPNTAEKSETFGLNLEGPYLDLSLESSTTEDLSGEDIPTSRQAESGFDQESISEETHSKFLKKENKFSNSDAKRFQCPTCKGWYKTEKYMKLHQATHSSKPKHQCPICSKAFYHRFRLTRHLRIHDKEGPYPCRQCSAIFIDHNQLKIHQREHAGKKVGEKFPQDPDNNIDKINDFRKRRMLNRNINDPNHVAGSTTILRDENSTVADSSIQRSGKKRTSRQIESRFDQDTTSSGQGEKRQKLSNSEEKRVKCPVCQSTFKDPRGMRRHLITHTSKPKYTCSFCSKSFWHTDRFSRHLRTHKDNGVDVRYYCGLCPAKFSKKDRLHRHKCEAHKNRIILKCRYCSKEYKSKKSLKNHENKRQCA